MSKCNKKKPATASAAVDQIIGNMTSDIQNADGQYIPLGFTPPPTPVSPYLLHFGGGEAKIGYPVDQFGQPSYSYIPQPFESYGGPSDIFGDYRPFVAPNHVMEMPNNTQLIENLVGNWTMPNASGTYSPFGNPHFVPNVNLFESQPEENFGSNGVLEDIHFQFRDPRKPRVVAEVKPMRPSYSDVLTKSAPVPKAKVDSKDNKQKKENRKGAKNEKNPKPPNLNRSNTNSDIKDVPADKTPTTQKPKPAKTNRPNQLNRKWVSLDNVAEASTETKVELQQKNKKPEEVAAAANKTPNKSQKKTVKNPVNDCTDTDSGNSKTETFTFNKNSVKKGSKGPRQKSYDSFGSNDRPPGKRGQRVRKRETHVPFGKHTFCCLRL